MRLGSFCSTLVACALIAGVHVASAGEPEPQGVAAAVPKTRTVEYKRCRDMPHRRDIEAGRSINLRCGAHRSAPAPRADNAAAPRADKTSASTRICSR
jgi:hypothetical protein